MHGFYGAGNVGDEAILGSTLDLLGALGMRATVLGVDADAIRSSWGVPSLSGKAGRGTAAGALLRSKAYVLGGGGLLKDFGRGSRNVRRWLEWLRLAQRAGVPTMLWSVGAENLDNEVSRRLIRDRLRDVDVVTVRDSASAERLREAGVERPIHVTADPVPAFVRQYRRPRPSRSGETRPVIGVSLRHWYARSFETVDDAAYERFLDELARALDHLAITYDATFLFVPFRRAAHDDDREVLRMLVSRMKTASRGEVRSDHPDVHETVRRLAQVDLVIGMRLHAAVIASALGVPTIALEYMPKVADYMAEIGQSAHVAPLREVRAPWLVAEAEDGLAHADARRQALEAATDRLADRFLLNGRLLQELVARRS